MTYTYTPDIRTCRFCGVQEYSYKDGVFRLVRYGTRANAHPGCLIAAKGEKAAKALCYEHEWRKREPDEERQERARLLARRAARAKKRERVPPAVRPATIKVTIECQNCGVGTSFDVPSVLHQGFPYADLEPCAGASCSGCGLELSLVHARRDDFR